MSYEITGNIVKRYETETKGESFRVREFVIKANDGGPYENFVKFQLNQDRVSLVDGLNKGDEIKVHFDLRGREWQEKYFTNLIAWRVEKLAEKGESSPVEPPKSTAPTALEPVEEASDDLPF